MNAETICWTQEAWWQYVLAIFTLAFILPLPPFLAISSRLIAAGVLKTRSFVAGFFAPLPAAVVMVIQYSDILKTWATQALSLSQEENHTGDKKHVARIDDTLSLLISPYRPETHYWESIFIGRRLVLIAFYTFLPSPTVRAVTLSIVKSELVNHFINQRNSKIFDFFYFSQNLHSPFS